VRRHIDLLALCALAFAAYALLSAVRHETFGSTGFDLGLFEQLVASYAEGRVPASAIKGTGNLLTSDHVSPVWVLAAPLYAVWPSPHALLAGQAALVVASAVPVHLYALPRLGRGPALALTAAYLLFGGVQEAVWFDVHEVAFAPVAIGAAVVLADRGRWGWSAVAALALLAVKEDLALLVVTFGAWYALQGERRLGAAVAAAGAAWFVLATQVVIGDYGYLDHALRLEPAMLRTTAYLLGAFLFASLLSPLVLLAAPLLAARALSANPKHWTLEDHYSLTVAPVLALAAAQGLARLGRPRAAYAMAALAVVATAAFPLRDLVRPSFYDAPAGYARALDAVPPGPVAATNRLAPHLSGRRDTTLLGPGPAPGTVVAALDDPSPEAVHPFADLEALRARVDDLRATHAVVHESGGVVVLVAGAPAAPRPTAVPPEAP
jgi:uncharacterized membrane protein